MLRFDSEADLESHELGRSLLLMIRDEDIGLQVPPPRVHFSTPVNPFDAIRSRLAAVDIAFEALQPQVHVVLDFPSSCSMPRMLFMPLDTAFCLFSHSQRHASMNVKYCSPIFCATSLSVAFVRHRLVGTCIQIVFAPMFAL